jgi:hypothetical protein
MPRYRCELVNDRQEISASLNIVCEDDVDAVAMSSQILRLEFVYAAAIVWMGDRRVAQVMYKDAAWY